MKNIVSIEQFTKLESETTSLRAELDELKKLVYKIDDIIAESAKATIKDFKTRRESVGE